MPEFDAITYTTGTDDRLWTRAYMDVDHNAWTARTIEETRLLTDRDLNEIFEKLYSIISEHTAIDISEEEFMKLIKDDS